MDRILNTLRGLVGLLVVMVVMSIVQSIIAGVDQLSLMRGADEMPDIVEVLKAFGTAFVALGGLVIVYGRKLGGWLFGKILDVVLGPVEDETEDEGRATVQGTNMEGIPASIESAAVDAAAVAQDAPRPSPSIKPKRGRPRKSTRRGRTRGGSNLFTIGLMVAVVFLVCKVYFTNPQKDDGGDNSKPSPKPIAALVEKIDETLGDSPSRAEDGLFLGAVCRAASEGMTDDSRIKTREQAAEGLVDNLGWFASRRLSRKYPGLSEVVGGHFIDRKFPEEAGALTAEDRALAVAIWAELGDAFTQAIK